MVNGFIAEAATRYPLMENLSDEDAEHRAWSDDPDVGEGHVILTIRRSQAIQVTNYVAGLADTYNLILFDPQLSVARLPRKR